MEKEYDQSAANGTQHDDGDETMDEDAAAKQQLNASSDPSKIKFTSVNLMDSKNGEAKVDIHLVQTSIGMGKEELMKYANEPFWVRLRLFLFVLFWVGWIAMLVGAVVIILLAPRCPPAPKLDWYQKTAMYQVDVKSFKDGDGDGVGDLRGLISKLDYFTSINVKTLLLNAFYSMAPKTGSVLNHTSIDNRFGTMTDFDDLVAEIKKRDMKLVLDFIPNHSSDEHPWFKRSIKNEEPYSDFYVWATSDTYNTPPNNWVSEDGSSSWEWNEERQQYYLHSFSKHEPDFNLHNELVRQELQEIMKFWLDKNVDGFKVKAASHLVEKRELWDEPLRTAESVGKLKYDDISHIYTLNQPENMELFAEWRGIISNYSETTGSHKILMAELSGPINDTVRYYGNSSFALVDFPLNTELTKLNTTSSSPALDLKNHLEVWTDSAPSYAWPNWVLGNEYTVRLADRVGEELIDGLYMVAALLRGTPITYYGDEIGMTNPAVDEAPLSEKSAYEFASIRPMMWNNETGTGSTNVSDEDALKKQQSHLKIFGRLNELRNQPAINFGIEAFPIVTDDVFSLIRVRKGSPGYLVVLNMGPNSTVVDFTDTQEKNSHLPETGRLEIRSQNINDGPLSAKDHPKIKLDSVTLGSKQAVVFSFVPKFED